jgi:hypothetical protein
MGHSEHDPRISKIDKAIAAQEAMREALGDEAVDVAIEALTQQRQAMLLRGEAEVLPTPQPWLARTEWLPRRIVRYCEVDEDPHRGLLR